MLAHELGEDRASASAVPIVHNHDVLCLERLGSDVAAVLVAGNVDASTVQSDERIGEIPVRWMLAMEAEECRLSEHEARSPIECCWQQ